MIKFLFILIAISLANCDEFIETNQTDLVVNSVLNETTLNQTDSNENRIGSPGPSRNVQIPNVRPSIQEQKQQQQQQQVNPILC